MTNKIKSFELTKYPYFVNLNNLINKFIPYTTRVRTCDVLLNKLRIFLLYQNDKPTFSL